MKPRFPRFGRPEPEVKTGTAANGEGIASSERALRVCETAGGPVIYIPAEDITPGALRPSAGRGSYCEWKGTASYFAVVTGPIKGEPGNEGW